MAIARKPKVQPIPSDPIDVDALIAKGGSVAQSQSEPDQSSQKAAPVTTFTLRVPNDIVREVDEHRKKGPYKVPRQQWILDAMLQRLERENAG